MNAWPTTDEIRATFNATDRLAFGRWLAQVRAEARRDALLEAAESFTEGGMVRRRLEDLAALADKEQGNE